MINETFGWISVLVGLLLGVALGLAFHREDWLGGYVSLRRRLVRLAHISLVALGFLNILFGLSLGHLPLRPTGLWVASWALMVGAISMPACCGLAAWRPALRQLFAIPIASLLLGVSLVVWGGFRP